MTNDVWLPKGYTLEDESKIRSLLHSGDDWQVFNTDGLNNILLASPELVQKWKKTGFLDNSFFCEIAFGTKSFWGLLSHKKYALEPVENGKSPESKVDALAFALALRESRKISDEVSFHDAIYLEQYSKLLPVWTLTPHIDDEVVLGTWVTGGVSISTNSFRRLINLTGWMPAGDLSEIVETAGFSLPADVGLLTRRKPKHQPKSDEEPTLVDTTVESENLRSERKTTQPKVFSLSGRPQLEEFFNEHVIDIIFNAEKYQAMGIEFPSAIILHGPPGCGQTFAVERLVEFIDWPSYSVDSSSVGSPYIHETSKKISEVFDKAIESAPSVIIIDEMESFLSDRQSGGSSGLHHVEEVAEFLRRIPEAISNKVLIIAMTNMIDTIDPAILRRGRFDHVIEVGMPSGVEVQSLLDSLLIKLPRAEDLNMDKILGTLTGKALSDSAFVIREAARLAAKNGKLQIDQESIDRALNSLPDENGKQGRRIGFDLEK